MMLDFAHVKYKRLVESYNLHESLTKKKLQKLLLPSPTFLELQLNQAGRSDVVVSQRVGIFDKNTL